MNGYMGENHPYTSGYRQFQKISEIADPKPSHAFVFTDEREDSISDGWFAVDMSSYDPRSPASYTIVDFPADWHNRADNLSFVDGHTETWRWQDARTMPRHSGGQLALGVASPNNPDVARIQAATTRRVVPGN